METTAKKSITVETVIHSPIEKIREHWTEPKHITRWYNASEDWHAPFAENDVRVNGKFKTTMATKNGSLSFDFEGIYSNVREHELITYHFADGRKVTITFTMQGNNIQVTETFEMEDVHPMEMQRSGWQNILDNFKKYSEGKK